MDDRTTLLFALPDFRVLDVTREPDGGRRVLAESVAEEGGCPACGVLSGGHCCIDGSHRFGEGVSMRRRRQAALTKSRLSVFSGFRFPPGVIPACGALVPALRVVLPGLGGTPR